MLKCTHCHTLFASRERLQLHFREKHTERTSLTAGATTSVPREDRDFLYVSQNDTSTPDTSTSSNDSYSGGGGTCDGGGASGDW